LVERHALTSDYLRVRTRLTFGGKLAFAYVLWIWLPGGKLSHCLSWQRVLAALLLDAALRPYFQNHYLVASFRGTSWQYASFSKVVGKHNKYLFSNIHTILYLLWSC
tara:strand:+ start:234 stop:554 length:321 start_codon:yes stop_codon:yes gene_type:complete